MKIHTSHPIYVSHSLISTTVLLGVMGFKEYMDQYGKFITEAEAEERVQEMRRVRESLLERLEYENKKSKEQREKLAKAHNEVVEEKRTKHQLSTNPMAVAATSPKTV